MKAKTNKNDADLLKRLDRLGQLLENIGPEILGHRVRRLRDQQGISVRDLADRAGINKNSIVRLEQGRGTQPITILKVCSVLGVHVERLAEPSENDMTLAVVHKKNDDRWFDAADMGSKPLLDSKRPLTPAQRKRAVNEGAQVPINLLKCRLPGGRVLPSVLEIWQKSPERSHVGEEFAFVLSGTAIITVGEKKTSLERRRIHHVLERRASLLRSSRFQKSTSESSFNSNRRLTDSVQSTVLTNQISMTALA